MNVAVPKDLCKQICELDKGIRFAGVVDKFGKLIMTKYRSTSIPLLSKEESQLSIVQGTIRMGSRSTLQPKLGKIVYTFTFYEKVKRATIPLTNNSYLMVSFDIEGDHDTVMMKKILPLLKKHDLHKY